MQSLPRSNRRRCSRLALAAPALAAVGLLCQLPAQAAFSASAEGHHVAVATDHGEATRAALEALRGGGSAVDGAVAAALVLGVVNPTASGLGGGGFALVYDAKEKKVTSLDFRESAPVGAVPTELVQRAVRGRGGAFDAARGVAVGVPGEPAGFEWLVKRFGRRSLADAAAPAVALAERGFPVGRFFADRIADLGATLVVSPELSAALLPGGNPVGFRAKLVRRELGRTLSRLGSEGAGIFYTGDIGAQIVRSARAAGGWLAPEDLAGYQARERAPLTRVVDGRTLVTMPAPSAGGLMVHEVVGMYGATPNSPLRAMGLGSSAYLHTLAEAMRGAVADRVRFAGDPEIETGVGVAYDRALDPTQLAARRRRIEPNKTHAAPEFRTREGGTTHVIVADAEGNVALVTTTINDPFGARIIAGDTGVLLNNELDDFSAPSELVGFGVIGLGPNRPRPGARPVSSMTPTLVFEGDKPILAVGGSGGPRIATAVTQATLARLVFGLDPSACVGAPRIHVTGSSTEIFVEPEIPDDVRAGLKARGETVKDDGSAYSAVEMIAWERGGDVRLLAAGDPRKNGVAAAQ